MCREQEAELGPQRVMDTTVADYVRKYMGARVTSLRKKPMFVYNTWRPFTYGIDEKLICELADAAAECGVIYARCMELFDELHAAAPDLFIDCTFETAGKLQLMDYGIAKHAEGNWLSNIGGEDLTGPMRMRDYAWGRCPALPATSLVIGNLFMDGPMRLSSYKSLTGSLPIMLGDPRKLSKAERAEFRAWSGWMKGLEERHGVMSFRQDLAGFGEPTAGCWDGFARINTETKSGGLVGVFRTDSAEPSRLVTVRDLEPSARYAVLRAPDGAPVAEMTGAELAEKGFAVTLAEKTDSALLEIVRLASDR